MSEMRWSVTEVAVMLTGELGRPVAPREITALIYDRRIPVELAPLVGGRRMLGDEAIARVAEILKTRIKSKGENDGNRHSS